jgi:hypothetical protein
MVQSKEALDIPQAQTLSPTRALSPLQTSDHRHGSPFESEAPAETCSDFGRIA